MHRTSGALGDAAVCTPGPGETPLHPHHRSGKPTETKAWHSMPAEQSAGRGPGP